MLLSDGDDTSSLIEFDQVLDLAKRSEVVIYAIGLRAGEIARREFKEAEFVLKQLANETGGRAFFVTDARELAKIYQGIWDELSSQYAIAYSSGNPKRDGAWRRVQVRLLRPNITARTKLGYYGPVDPGVRASEPESLGPGPLTMILAWLPFGLYAAAAAAYLAHFSHHDERAGRLATALLGGGRRSPTPSSSACRRWKRATRRSSARPPRCRRSSGSWASPISTSS